MTEFRPAGQVIGHAGQATSLEDNELVARAQNAGRSNADSSLLQLHRLLVIVVFYVICTSASLPFCIVAAAQMIFLHLDYLLCCFCH